LRDRLPTPLGPRWAFEDFEPGQTFVSQGRTVTETDIVMFGGWSWDTNPVHTDAITQASSRFGDRIGHGLLGMSVAMGLASRLGVFEDCSLALLGVDRWRFLAPIRIGDTVHLKLEILSTRVTSSGDSGVLERSFSLINQNNVVVQQGEITLLVSMRNPQRH
jgi:acyl dehydratase